MDFGLDINAYTNCITIANDDGLSKFINFCKNHCENCEKYGKMMRCSKCDSVYYCSKECQKEDYKNHKHNCVCNAFNREMFFTRRMLVQYFEVNLLTNEDIKNDFKNKKFWQLRYVKEDNVYLFNPMPYDLVSKIVEENDYDIKTVKGFVRDLDMRKCFKM